jgi:hypothetical protein
MYVPRLAFICCQVYVWLISMYERELIKKFPDWVDNEIHAYVGITRWEATKRVMEAKLNRLTHKIAIQLQLVAKSCTICNSRSRRPVRKLLDTPSYYVTSSPLTKYMFIFKRGFWLSQSRDSSVSVGLGYQLDDRGSSVRFPAGAGNFSLHHRVQKGSGAHQTPIQWVQRAPSLGIKRPEREADHSPPSSAEVKNAWSYTSTPRVFHGVVLS